LFCYNQVRFNNYIKLNVYPINKKVAIIQNNELQPATCVTNKSRRGEKKNLPLETMNEFTIPTKLNKTTPVNNAGPVRPTLPNYARNEKK
jgi:hypothetical protein